MHRAVREVAAGEYPTDVPPGVCMRGISVVDGPARPCGEEEARMGVLRAVLVARLPRLRYRMAYK